MKIDSHQHFWEYSAEDYPWIGAGMDRLARDFLPADLERAAATEGVVGSVAVQARQSLAESHWLLGLAERHPFVRGVVGWVDLRSEHVVDDLAALAANERFVGVRHVVQDEPDPRFLLNTAFMRGLGHLHRYGLTYDLLLYPLQLPAAKELVGQLPDQPFVLDHLAKPGLRLPISARDRDQWRRDIEAVATHRNVCCKLSGLVTEAAWGEWQPADFRPVLDVALTAFGPGRLMFGSDWPVCLLSGDYGRVAEIIRDFIAPLSPAEQNQIWGGTATRFYGLK